MVGIVKDNMKAVIDQVEDEWIVFVDDKERTFELPLEYFPEGTEGDHVEIMITKNIDAKKEAEERVQDLRSKLKRVSIGD